MYTFLAELPRFDNSQNVKMMTSDQIEPILFLAGDDSAEESAKRREVQRSRQKQSHDRDSCTEKAVFVDRVRDSCLR